MAKTYYDSRYEQDSITHAYSMGMAAPFDSRVVVDTYEDLYTKSTFKYAELYKGMMVVTLDTNEVYVLVTIPKVNVTSSKWPETIVWKKVSGEDNINIPENVSAFINDAGYLTGSDVEDFVSTDELEEVLADYASQSDLNLYVKTDDVIDYIEQNGDFVKKDEIKNFVEASDLAEYVSVDSLDEILTEKGLDDFVSQSDLKVYVNREELTEYVTSSDLDNRLASIEIPENVSAFHNDAGYLTETDLPDFLTASDVEDFISVDQLNGVLADYASQSDLDVYVKTKDVVEYIEQNGDFVKSDEIKNFLEASDVADFITVDQVNEILTEKGVDDFVSQSDLTVYVNRNELVNYVTSSDLNNYAPIDSIPTEGMFPADSDVDAEEAVVDGYATVQDVMDYVNALLEKKKDELTEPEYFYVNAVIYTGSTPTLTPIYQMNCIELTDDVNTDEGMVLEVVASSEKYGLDGEGDETIDSFSQVFSIDIMDGYTIDVYARDPMNPSGYSNVKTNLIANPRGATKQYGSKTYNSYIRDVNGDYYENVYGSQVRYKLIIKKSN